METQNTNVKKTRTQYYLEQALLMLLKKKSFNEITVREMTEKAGISRTSFYAQFSSKQEFAEKIIADQIQALHYYCGTDKIKCFNQENFQYYYARFYEYFEQNVDFFKAMFSPSGIPFFYETLKRDARQIWKEKYFHALQYNPLDPKENEQAELLLEYICSAHIGLIEYWIRQPSRATPIYMSTQITNLTWLIIDHLNAEKINLT